MSEARRARGLLGRADLVALLADPGEASAEAAGAVASLLGLERAPRSPPEPPTPEPLPISEPPPAGFPEPRIQPQPLLDTPFWQVETAEFEPDSPGERAVPPPVYTGWRCPPRHPPVFHPLATWAELAPRLRQVLSDYREACAVDLDLTVRRISRGQILDRFPRERRRRWGPALLLEDDSRRLIPYRIDKSLVRAALRRVLPGHALNRAVLREGGVRPCPVGAKAGDWPPPPGTLVLVLGDLGCLAVEGAPLREFWRDLGRELRAGGAHPLALFPGPLDRCPPELAALWRLVPWERPRDGDGLSPERRAERLLRLVSPASRIEPALLRAARLLLPPEQADAATEADVWQHPALIGDSAAGATLDPEQARLLRTAFAREEPPSLRRRLIRLVKAWRRGLPPEIWFDELLNADPEARAGEEFRADLEDARGYFAAFCAEVPASEALALPAHDREWLDRIRVRSTQSLWDDPVVGARLAARAVELARGRPDAGSDGIRAGQIDPEGLPERRWRLIQSGDSLAAIDPSAAPEPVGSPFAEVASRTGRIDIEPVDERGAFWETGTPPPWAKAWGWDRYGAWVEFSVTGRDGTPVDQRLRWIEPGSFMMGSPGHEPGRSSAEGPRHEVAIREGFWLFDTACPQVLWEAVMGENPSRFRGGGRPVERVSWHDAQGFIEALNARLPGLDLGLPSEAQWEYACRAGTQTPFGFGANITPEEVNYEGNYPYAGGNQGRYRQETVPVGSLPPNPWGLYEMHGNVWEWVQDTWQGDYQGAPVDGSPWETGPGAGRVIRGGSWSFDARDCRSAYRNGVEPDNRGYGLGFRCARVQGRESGGPGASGALESGAARPVGEREPFVRWTNAAARTPGREVRAGADDTERMRAREGPAGSAEPRRFVARSGGVSMPDGDSTPSTTFTGSAHSARSQAPTWEPAALLRLDVATSASIAFPESPAFRIVTDRARLTLRRGVKPGWARAMGRDCFGLWAEIGVEPKQGGEPVIQRLRWIPPGRFPMGSPEDELGRWYDEGPRHPVTMAAGYWLFDTPCTQALWEAVMGENPSRFQDPERPVEQVSWNQVREEFLPALNRYFAESPGDDRGRFVLPSEAQWEYACRAGTETALYTGPIEILGRNSAPALDPIAWYGGNSGVDYDLKEAHETTGDLWTEMQYPTQRAGTRKVKAKAANAWGLHDMLGNVFEWVEDPWHENYEGAPPDGRVWASSEAGADRVIRGGSWYSYAGYCRSAYRDRFEPDDRNDDLGFRCARVQL